METEIWRPVIGYAGRYEGRYQVSSLGRIQNCKTKRILKQQVSAYGYYQISLEGADYKDTIGVHRLVAQAFSANPKGLKIVHHRDGNKQNNAPLNLEWTTHRQNISEYHKRAIQGTTTEFQKSWLKRLWGDGYTERELSQIFAVTMHKVEEILAAP